MSGMSVTLEDFELDIADYLWAESERLGQTDDLFASPRPYRLTKPSHTKHLEPLGRRRGRERICQQLAAATYDKND